MGWARRTYGGGECIQGFDGATSGEKSLGRPRRGWEDNIEIDPKWVGDVYWIDMA